MWIVAEPLIRQHIFLGMQLDPRNRFRYVEEIPPYNCFRNGYYGCEGYKISVGVNASIEIPMDLLRSVYEYCINNNGGIYNKNVIKLLFPNLYNQKPCIVHTVGKLFEQSGIATQISQTDYQF